MKTLFTGILFGVTVFYISFAWAAGSELVEYEENYWVSGNEFRVDLDVDGAEVTVNRHDRGNQCYVKVIYDKQQCDADVRYDEDRDELRIDIDHENLNIIKGEDGGTFAKIVLSLPGRPSIDLYADIKAGDIDFELGDLYLRSFELSNLAGDVSIDFNKPNLTEMEILDINVKVGELRLANLGNANFRQAEINGGIGEMTLDFSGDTLKRGMARIDLDIGETSIILPKTLGIKLRISKFLFLSNVNTPSWFKKRGNYYYSENYKDADESLYLTISSGIGELDIEVR
jgi:predicted membrane protein